MKKRLAQNLLSAISRQQSAKKAEGGKLKTDSSETGFSSLAFLTVLGLFLAITLALIGTGTIKLPGNKNLAISPIPISDPVEDDEACNDPYNADCEQDLKNDPENLTPAQIQQELEKN